MRRLLGGHAAHTRHRAHEERREQRLPAGRADVGIDGVLRVRHQPDDVAALVPDAGDGVRGAVRVVVVVERAVGRAVAEHDEALVLDPLQVHGVRDELPLAVLDRDLEHLARRRAPR